MQQIAWVVTQLLVTNEIIDTDEQEVYAYGLQLLLTSGVTGGVILLVGLICHEMPLTLLFMLLLIGLRHYTGGYHAQTYLKCFCISCLCYLGMLLTVHFAGRLLPVGIALIGSWIADLLISYQGSLNSAKNPKTKEEMQERKKITRCLSTLYSVMAVTLWLTHLAGGKVIWLIFYVQFITAFGILSEKIKRGM